MNFKAVTLVILFFGLAFQSIAEASSAKTTVKVGVALRFEEASQEGFINSFMNGFELARKQFITAHPELNIEFVKYSHKSSPDSIIEMAQKVVKDKIQFVLGGESSDEVRVMGETFEPAKVLMISPTSSDPEVTAGKNFIFRACFADDDVSKRLAKYVFAEILKIEKPQTIAIVHNTGNGYTHFLTKTFFEEIKRLNQVSGKKSKLTILKKEYAGANYDFTEMVNSFSSSQVSKLVLFTGKDDFLHFVETAQKKKFFPLYIGSDGWGTNQSIVENLGRKNLLKEFEGIHNSYWYEESTRPEVIQFIKDYKNKYAHAPDGWSAIAYDSAKMLFDALLKSNGTPAAAAKTLKSTEYDGLVTTPKLKFGAGNSPKKTLYLYTVFANRPEFKAALE